MEEGNNNVPTLYSLPDHLIEHIYSFLGTPADCSTLARTCKRFHEVADAAHVFSGFTCSIDADEDYDLSVPVANRMQSIYVWGSAAQVIQVLSDIAGMVAPPPDSAPSASSSSSSLRVCAERSMGVFALCLRHACAAERMCGDKRYLCGKGGRWKGMSVQRKCEDGVRSVRAIQDNLARARVRYSECVFLVHPLDAQVQHSFSSSIAPMLDYMRLNTTSPTPPLPPRPRRRRSPRSKFANKNAYPPPIGTHRRAYPPR